MALFTEAIVTSGPGLTNMVTPMQAHTYACFELFGCVFAVWASADAAADCEPLLGRQHLCTNRFRINEIQTKSHEGVSVEKKVFWLTEILKGSCKESLQIDEPSERSSNTLSSDQSFSIDQK